MAEGEARTWLQRMAGFMGLGNWSSRPGPPTAGPAGYTDAGWIPFAWGMNYGQLGYDPIPGGWNAVAYSCIMLYARTISQLPGRHMKKLDNNGTEQITTSALSRVLQRPNDYQTRLDFLRNMVIWLLAEGNSYAIALRNDRNEITELHQVSSRATRALYGEDGEVFYSVGGNPILNYRLDPEFGRGARWIVPQRDMLHFCGPSKPEDPLTGESPLIAASGPVDVSTGGFAAFLRNMSRPSGVLSTDLILTKEQVRELRERWEEQAKGVNQGGVPILTAGLKWGAQGFKPEELQIVESLKLSKKDIAMIFGVPLALINDMDGATYNNSENLIMMWLRQGLGYYLDQCELAFDKLFRIEVGVEYTEFDVEALLRPDSKSRIETLVRGVLGGIYAPNEARALEGLAKAKDGEEPRVQQQVVPLSWWESDMAPQPGGGAPPAEEPAPADADKGAEIFDFEEYKQARARA
jgi:HK97 family phage portal protein